MTQLARIFCVIIGFALAVYGIALMAGLDALNFSKYSADGRDTNSAILILLIGISIAVFGFFGNGGKSGGTNGQ